jgi:hypothetical protein
MYTVPVNKTRNIYQNDNKNTKKALVHEVFDTGKTKIIRKGPVFYECENFLSFFRQDRGGHDGHPCLVCA